MGQCCQKTAKFGAFHSDLGSPLLINELSNRLPPDAKVLHLRLVALKDIASGSAYNGLSDPYVEIKLMPNDPVAGSQQQSSEVRPQTLNPKWVCRISLFLNLTFGDEKRVYFSSFLS